MAMRSIPTPSYLDQCFSYNPQTGHLTWHTRPMSHFGYSTHKFRSWNRNFAGKIAGAIIQTPARHHYNASAIVCLNRQNYAQHRIIWVIVTRFPPNGEIDHINGDSTDNRWANLRLASRTENARNRGACRSLNHGMPKGVYPNPQKRTKQFAAAIVIAGKRKHIGYYETIEEAHNAYCNVARSIHGEFFNSGHQLATAMS